MSTGPTRASEIAADFGLTLRGAEFLDFLARGRRTEGTLKWYAKHLRSLHEAAGAGWEDDEMAIGRWIAAAHAPAYARGRRRAVGAFLRWMEHPSAPAWLDGRRPAIPHPRGFDPLPIVLTTPQQRRLLGEARQSPREYAAVLALLDTGARVGELARVGTADLAPGSLRLWGKTGPRIVPLGALASDALLDAAGDGSWCFAGRQGGPVTSKGLSNRIGRLFRRAGFPKGGAHVLRHTFATTYIAGGGSLVRLQHILGHTSVSTTERYIHLAANDLATDHARLSPLAALGAGIQLRLVGEETG